MLSLHVISTLAMLAAWAVAGLMAWVFVAYGNRRRVDAKAEAEFEEIERRVEAARRQL